MLYLSIHIHMQQSRSVLKVSSRPSRFFFPFFLAENYILKVLIFHNIVCDRAISPFTNVGCGVITKSLTLCQCESMEKTSRCQHIPKGERVSVQVYRDLVVCEEEAKLNYICDCTALPDKDTLNPEKHHKQYSRESNQVIVLFSSIKGLSALNNSSLLNCLMYDQKSRSSKSS